MCCGQQANVELARLAGVGGLGIDWGQLIATQTQSWSSTIQDILKGKNLPRGVYTQTGPGGTTTYVQPTGTQANIFGATATGATANSGMGIVLIGGAALLLVFMLARK
jgi:hypothetical protein